MRIVHRVTPVLLVKAAGLPVREGARRAADAKVLRAKPVNVRQVRVKAAAIAKEEASGVKVGPKVVLAETAVPADVPAADVSISRRTSISEKLIGDSLYLDNQAHAVVVRIRDMDSGTRSTLRRLYNSVRRATRAPENERQHEFVMLRARLAYTIARHGLRSLDQIERLLLQVTRKNEARGYERFRDLFEAIVAYNE